MRFTYYPGCASSSFAKEHDSSSRLISGLLGIDLAELENWNCCGGPLFMTHQEATSQMTRRLLGSAKDAGGQCIVTTCELCHFNLDARQPAIENRYGEKYSMLIVHFTQFLVYGWG